MKQEQKMIQAFIDEYKRILLILTMALGIFGLVFYLYQIPIDAIIYSLVLCLCLLGMGIIIVYLRFRTYYRQRQRLFQSVEYNLSDLGPAHSLMEQDYRDLLEQVIQESQIKNRLQEKQLEELKEYVLMWAHQIKTPITAINLVLQQELEDCQNQNDYEDILEKLEQEPEGSSSQDLGVRHYQQVQSLREEILEVENYTNMTLQYMRLDSMNADFIVKEYSLQELVKDDVRYFSKTFITKHLTVQLEHLDYQVVTDQKWFSFVLKQILSNALKYTKTGGITISARTQDERVYLSVKDTGCGIAAQDLPRIFERAFTGYNGHMNQKSTGIGLFLSQKILDKLGHGIKVESTPGVGTDVVIMLPMPGEL